MTTSVFPPSGPPNLAIEVQFLSSHLDARATTAGLEQKLYIQTRYVFVSWVQTMFSSQLNTSGNEMELALCLLPV